jgi:hypothetical protein
MTRGAQGSAAAPLVRALLAGVCAAGLSAAVVAAVAPAELAAQQRSIALDRFHADIDVRPDGDLVVVETLEPRFVGSWNGFIRSLSLRPPEDYGAGHQLDVRVVSVEDPDGRALRHEVTWPGRATMEVRIWVPDAMDRTATVILTYTVRGALGFFEAHPDGEWDAMDELYWNVTGSDWEMTIGRASARVVLPPGAAPVQADAYVGRPTSTTRTPVHTLEDGISVADSGPLPEGHGLTIGVGWPAGFVDRTSAVSQRTPAGWRLRPRAIDFWPILVPIAVFLLAFRTWDQKGREPGGRAITVRWDPPEDLSAVEAGTLVDHNAEMHDILSILVDLAVRGYLVIEEQERTGWLSSGTDYTFHLMKSADAWDDLAPYERRFLDGLFDPARRPSRVPASGGGGFLSSLLGTMGGPARPAAPEGAIDSVRLADLQSQFYKEVPKIQDDVYDGLIRKGHYVERPDKVRARWIGAAGITFIAGSAAVFLLLSTVGDGRVTSLVLAIATMATSATLSAFGWIMPARTDRGVRARDQALGFKRFLERVETPRFKRMITSPDLFERFLPYAMAFKCEETWARAFDDLLVQPPDWYRGGTAFVAFRPSAFAKDLGSMSAAAGTTLSSSPSSSGSGGGGSSGGGGGGGGGSGF